MNAAWLSLCGLGLLGIWLLRDAITDMCKEEIRTRLSRLPYAVLRIVVLRIQRPARQDALSEWTIELDFILGNTDGLPVTRLLRGIHYSASLLVRTMLPFAVIRELVATFWWRASSYCLNLATGMGGYTRLVAAMDGMTALAAGQVAFLTSFHANGKPAVAYLAISLGLPLIWIPGVMLAGGYDEGVAGSGLNEFRRILGAGLSLTVGIAVFTSVMDTRASHYLLIALLMTTAIDLVTRFILSKYLHPLWKATRSGLRVVAVGTEQGVANLIAELQHERYYGIRVVAACLSQPSACREISRVPVYGGLDDITAAVRFFTADTAAVLKCREMDGSRLRALAEELRKTHTDLCVSSPLLLLRRLAGVRLVIKDLFDRCLSAAMLILLAPVLAALAMTIWLSDGGPPLCTEVRVSENGREFRIYKFRTMVIDAEHHGFQAVTSNSGEQLPPDPRIDSPITVVGAHLRRWSIDGLPQLINVVLGHMSLVGSRPVLPNEAAKYPARVSRSPVVKPGLTGLWQIMERPELSWDELVRLDTAYIDRWSFTLDLQILWRAGTILLHRSGAY